MSLGQLELQNCTAYANSSGGFHYDQTGVSFIIRSRRSPKLRFFDVKNCAFPLKLNLSFFSFKSCIASVMAKTGFYSRLELGRFIVSKIPFPSLLNVGFFIMTKAFKISIVEVGWFSHGQNRLSVLVDPFHYSQNYFSSSIRRRLLQWCPKLRFFRYAIHCGKNVSHFDISYNHSQNIWDKL